MTRPCFRSTLSFALTAILAAPLAVDAANARLSLPVTGALVEGGADLNPSGSSGALRLRDVGSPGFAQGFTLPHDYQANTPLLLAVLAQTEATHCTMRLRGAKLVRARAGRAADQGDPAAGLEPLVATTKFSISKRDITFAAAAQPRTTVKIQYRIVPTPGEFPDLKPADAVLFSLVRLSEDPTDDCNATLEIAGASIVYTRRTSGLPARSRLSLDPFHAWNENERSVSSWPGTEPPVRLDAAGAVQSANFGFTVPPDQKPNTVVNVEFLWSTSSTNCVIALATAGLFRSRVGHLADHRNGSASDGLRLVSSSTPFQVDGDDLDVRAPQSARATARVSLAIEAGGGFNNLRPGDTVSFGIFRRAADFDDTCAGDFAIVGASVVYERTGQPPATGAVSLSPYPLFLTDPARVEPSAFDGTLRLPAPTLASIPGFFGDFVIPADYDIGEPLNLRLLVAGTDTGCHFVLFPTLIVRARGEQPVDAGSNQALVPLRASTPFSTLPAGDLRFAATAQATRTLSVEFQIPALSGSFPELRAGDAVTFGFYRDGRRAADTCPQELQVAGLSIVYPRK